MKKPDSDPRVLAAEAALHRPLTVDEKAAVLSGAEVINGEIVESSQGGKVSEARK